MHYFDDIINILLDEELYENILIYNILHKPLIDAKHLCIMFNKVDEFIRDYNVTKYLALFGSEKYNAIFNGIRYLLKTKKWYFI